MRTAMMERTMRPRTTPRTGATHFARPPELGTRVGVELPPGSPLAGV